MKPCARRSLTKEQGCPSVRTVARRVRVLARGGGEGGVEVGSKTAPRHRRVWSDALQKTVVTPLISLNGPALEPFKVLR